MHLLVKVILRYFLCNVYFTRVILSGVEPVEENGTLHYDEASAYFNCRYMTAGEASWRLLGYDLLNISHTVIVLAVHLEGEQEVCFRVGDEAEALGYVPKLSTLEAFMEHNKGPQGHLSRHLLYVEVPQHFTFTGP